MDAFKPPRAAIRAARRRHPRKDKQIAAKFFPGNRFFALHKPECADLRELEKAIHTIRDTSRT